MHDPAGQPEHEQLPDEHDQPAAQPDNAAQPDHAAQPDNAAPPSIRRSLGGSFVLYTMQRLLFFVIAGLVLAVFGLRGFPLLLVALLVSSVLSLFVMRGQRDSLTRAAAQRGAAKRAEKERLARRLREE